MNFLRTPSDDAVNLQDALPYCPSVLPLPFPFHLVPLPRISVTFWNNNE